MTITMYTKPGCPGCRMTAKFLTKNGIDYDAVDVTEDAAALGTVQALGYQSLPVIQTDESHWSGYQPDRLTELLAAV